MTEVLVALAAVLGVYPTLRRWGVWAWLAALATAAGLVGAVTLADPTVRSAILAVPVAAAAAVMAWSAPPHRRAQSASYALVLAGVVTWRLAGGSDPATLDPASAGVVALVAIPLALAVSAAGSVGRAAASGMRWVCLYTVTLVALTLVLARGDALTALAWSPAAGALGLTALVRGRRSAAAERPQADAVDEQVLAAFERERPGRVFAPVVVVIAAYNEAAGLPAVLRSLPTEACGLPVDVLVVDDGSSDGTADAARAAPRGCVVACPANRGQGAALRLGYRIAREHGAAYVVTTDADGQYAADEIAAVLAPVVEGRADFVTGSRRLGVLENADTVRQVGTYVFAWLASALLGRHVTDTSFGLRAMRAEVTAAVTLNEPQYQASELLVGVVSHGFRVLEVPGTMRRRSAGSTKKGHNLVYGSRYARVLLGTWWREACPRPVAETAPALQGSTRHVPADVPV